MHLEDFFIFTIRFIRDCYQDNIRTSLLTDCSEIFIYVCTLALREDTSLHAAPYNIEKRRSSKCDQNDLKSGCNRNECSRNETENLWVISKWDYLFFIPVIAKTRIQTIICSFQSNFLLSYLHKVKTN